MLLNRVCGALLALTLCLSPLSGARAEDDIKIGAFLSLTGVMSLMGDPEKKALDLLVETVNADGGVLGRKISLIVYDDGSDPEKAVSFVRRLIDHDQVDLVIGGSGTPTSLAVLTQIERERVPYLSMGGGGAIVDPVRKWVFKVPQTDRMAAEKVLADLKKRGLTKIALLSENGGFGKSGHDQTVARAASYGIEILVDETYSPKDPDVTPQLTKIRGTPGLQALFVFGTGNGPAVVTKNIRQIGLTLPVYQSHGVASRDFLRLVGGAADGMRLPGGALSAPEQLPDSNPRKALLIGFKTAYEARTHTDINMMAGHSYDALMLAVDAIRRAGTTDKAAVRDALEATANFPGTAGMVTFSPTDHLGLGADAFHMLEIRNGAFTFVD
jgi:branched-chain amino acid transport system substrate-binding protein